MYEMAAKVLKTSEVQLMSFCANTKFRFSKPPLHKYPNRCGEIRSAPFATTFARITSASCAAASRTAHNKLICKILKSRVNSNLELHKSARTLPAMLGRPYRTTRFDRQKIDICKTNGKAENRKE